MALFTPTNQKRLTNVSVVRLKKGGIRFELACYPNKVRAWREKLESNLDEVLQTRCVFTNVSKGQFSNRKEMFETFKCDNEDKIIVIILEQGELQLTEKERQNEQHILYRDVAKIISEKCVNPENNRAYTVTMVEKMMKDCHISLKANKSAKQHSLEIIKILKSSSFKITPAMMAIIITLSRNVPQSTINRIVDMSVNVIRQGNIEDDFYELALMIEPEKYGSIERFLQSELKEKYSIELLANTQSTSTSLEKCSNKSTSELSKTNAKPQQVDEDIACTSLGRMDLGNGVSNEKHAKRKSKRKQKRNKKDDDWPDDSE